MTPDLPFHEPGDENACFVEQIHWPSHEEHRDDVRGRSDDGSEEENDYRRFSPRFQGANFQKNLELVDKVNKLATQKGCTASQLALAWVLAQGDHIFPIPGTKKINYLEENVGSLNVVLSPAELKEIDTFFPKDAAAGLRYPEQMMASINR